MARLVARSAERLLDELPTLLARCTALDEAAELARQHVNGREFKFYFIVTASRVVRAPGALGGGGVRRGGGQRLVVWIFQQCVR